MLQFNDPVEYQDVVGDAFDEEVGAFEEMFGSLDDIEALEEMTDFEGELKLIDDVLDDTTV